MMHLTAVGLNYQTAPLNIRERLAFTAPDLPAALNALAGGALSSEAVILSTCNRTEVYTMGSGYQIACWFADYHQLPHHEVLPYLYIHEEEAAVRHAFRVACGLDSMVLGEPQILGQLKDAVHAARLQHALGPRLHALFQKTFAAAKDIRTNTLVGARSVSMASASVKMAEQIFPSIADLNVLFVGAGEMIELVATYFAAKKPRKIMVLNRTLARAKALCDKFDVTAEAATLAQLPAVLHEYDVVISSTASPLPVIGKGLVERSIKTRRGMPMFLLDLAVPRDIEAEVATLDDAYVYTVDDMAGIVENGKEARQLAAKEAESRVQMHVEAFRQQLEARRTVPLIRALRKSGEAARVSVLENALKHLARGEAPEAVLERLSVQLTNKLLHAPTRVLNKDGSTRPELTQAISQIYHLSDAE